MNGNGLVSPVGEILTDDDLDRIIGGKGSKGGSRGTKKKVGGGMARRLKKKRRGRAERVDC